MPTSFEQAIPIELQGSPHTPPQPAVLNEQDDKVRSYVINWRNQLRTFRVMKRTIWDECWQLYRGKDNFDAKQDWQTKIVLPKAWSSVKQATSAVKRLLQTPKLPWQIESVNPEDLVEAQRAAQMTDLTKVFTEKAHFIEEFLEGLELGFILGIGVWKLWWGLVPRTRMKVQNQIVQVPYTPINGQAGPPLATDFINPKQSPPPFGQSLQSYQQQDIQAYPEQLPQEALNPLGWGVGPMGAPTAPQSNFQIQKQLVREEILEGKLFIRAVDPYNFYWLPGSKINRWAGTIEDIEVPKWELLEMAKQGMFDPETIKSIKPMRLDEYQKKSQMRFDEPIMAVNGPTPDTGLVKLTEYYGPIVIDGEVVESHGHVIIANDNTVLLNQKNPFLHNKPPYVGFSPLSLPLRTEGVGLVEMVRAVDKALSELANLSVDTLLFRLMPLFEVTPEVYENPEDLETGITPGKILRKNLGQAGTPGITPIAFEDISQGAIQVAASLDRSHQEGSLTPEIQQAIPRYRGSQTATETQLMQQNQESFMGAMAADIEGQALQPMIEMAMDLIFQFIDTANDPRVASILGVGAEIIQGMSKEEIMEMIQGDYKVKATGITSQLQKAEMLQNLIQVMNLIGQNPQAWLPYINQDAFLRRIIESFRPTIHDIDNLMVDPATAQAREAAIHYQEISQQVPQLIQAAQDAQQQQVDVSLKLQEMEHQKQLAEIDKQMQMVQLLGQLQQQQAQQQQQTQQAPQQRNAKS